MARLPPDVNVIAARTLAAATDFPYTSEMPPKQRPGRAAKLAALAKLEPLTHSERRELSRVGNLVQWGDATLGIMPAKSSNTDTNVLAKRILDEATGEAHKTLPPPAKNTAAQELGRLGGMKGGAARKAALTPEQRSAIAKNAAAKRWTGNQ